MRLVVDLPFPGVLPFTFDSALASPSVFLSCRWLHRSLRRPLVEKATVATSLTHFAFWRRHRIPRVAARGASHGHAVAVPLPGAVAPDDHDSARSPLTS